MKLKQIGKTIIEKNIDFTKPIMLRETVRAVILDNKKVLMLYSSLFNDYTFPGGGVKKDESKVAALKRELHEELGASKITILEKIGYTKEIKYSINGSMNQYEQISYYYLVKIDKMAKNSLTKQESTLGLKAKLVDIDNAIKHNRKIHKDNLHQQTGLNTVLCREELILKQIKKGVNMRKFEVVTAYKDKNIELPKRATNKSAGYDLATIEDCLIKPGEIKLIKTGIKAQMPANEALFVFPRSSLAIKKGLMMSNGVGVVDSDYYNNQDNEGHIYIPLYNFTSNDVKLLSGERVAQGIFMKYFVVSNEEKENIVRLGGFGSSGK